MECLEAKTSNLSSDLGRNSRACITDEVLHVEDLVRGVALARIKHELPVVGEL